VLVTDPGMENQVDRRNGWERILSWLIQGKKGTKIRSLEYLDVLGRIILK
jgi:hypothetical protein